MSGAGAHAYRVGVPRERCASAPILYRMAYRRETSVYRTVGEPSDIGAVPHTAVPYRALAGEIGHTASAYRSIATHSAREKFSQNNKSADIRPFDLVSYVKDANDNTNIPTSTGTMDPESAFAWIVVVSLWFWAYFKVRQVLR